MQAPSQDPPHCVSGVLVPSSSKEVWVVSGPHHSLVRLPRGSSLLSITHVCTALSCLAQGPQGTPSILLPLLQPHGAGGNQAAPDPLGTWNSHPMSSLFPAKGKGLGEKHPGEHPLKQAWQHWRSVTNPAQPLVTQGSTHTPAQEKALPAPSQCEHVHLV